MVAGSAKGSSGMTRHGRAAAHRAHGQPRRTDDGHLRPLPSCAGRQQRIGRAVGSSRRLPPGGPGQRLWRVYTARQATRSGRRGARPADLVGRGPTIARQCRSGGMADAEVSNTSGGNPVRVRLSPSAPSWRNRRNRRTLLQSATRRPPEANRRPSRSRSCIGGPLPMAESTARRRGNGEGYLKHDPTRDRWRGAVAWTDAAGPAATQAPSPASGRPTSSAAWTPCAPSWPRPRAGQHAHPGRLPGRMARGRARPRPAVDVALSRQARPALHRARYRQRPSSAPWPRATWSA